MERLTKYQPDNFYDYGDNQVNDELINEWYYKLQCLEDIEEELGCSIEILFKAIKNGIYFVNENNNLEHIDEALCFNQKTYNKKFVFDNYGYHCKNIEEAKGDEIYLEDYKKTWWLKEDKSE